MSWTCHIFIIEWTEKATSYQRHCDCVMWKRTVRPISEQSLFDWMIVHKIALIITSIFMLLLGEWYRNSYQLVTFHSKIRKRKKRITVCCIKLLLLLTLDFGVKLDLEFVVCKQAYTILLFIHLIKISLCILNWGMNSF